MNNTSVPNYPGSVEIAEVLHNNGTKTEDITKLVVLIDIHTAINVTSSFCEIVIADFDNWMEKLEFGSGDVVSFTLNHSGITNERRYRIKSITDIINLENGKTYKLKLISELEFISTHKKISKAYEGTPSEIAQIILSENTPENADVWEPAVNVISYIAPAVSPLYAIDWLARKSYTNDMNERMMFFQNSKQFWNFVSLPKLRTMYQGSTTYRYYANTLSNNGVPSQEEILYSIKHIIYHNSFDLPKEIRKGNIKNTFFVLDPTQKGLNIVTYDYWNDYSNKSLNPRMHWKQEDLGMGNLKIDYATTLSTEVPEFRKTWDSSDADFYIPQGQVIEIGVVGNPEIDIGQIINIEIPSQEVTNRGGETKLDQVWSGKYYIYAKRDQIDKNGHGMVLRLVKDSFI